MLRFLGTINYLGRFIANLSTISEPVRKLLGKDIAWHFDTPQIKAVDQLKQMITSSPILKFFDTQIPIRISCDASQSGLGAILEQKHGEEWHPVAYASRSLNTAERNYCQIEKEMLSIVFSCERFKEYVYVQKFEILIDHLPLRSIFDKPLWKSPAQLQRFLLRLQRYNFNMKYLRGKHLVITILAIIAQ